MKLNYKIIFHFFGLLLLFNGGFMLLAALLSFFYKDGATFNLFLAGISVLVFRYSYPCFVLRITPKK